VVRQWAGGKDVLAPVSIVFAELRRHTTTSVAIEPDTAPSADWAADRSTLDELVPGTHRPTRTWILTDGTTGWDVIRSACMCGRRTGPLSRAGCSIPDLQGGPREGWIAISRSRSASLRFADGFERSSGKSCATLDAMIRGVIAWRGRGIAAARDMEWDVGLRADGRSCCTNTIAGAKRYGRPRRQKQRGRCLAREFVDHGQPVVGGCPMTLILRPGGVIDVTTRWPAPQGAILEGHRV